MKVRIRWIETTEAVRETEVEITPADEAHMRDQAYDPAVDWQVDNYACAHLPWHERATATVPGFPGPALDSYTTRRITEVDVIREPGECDPDAPCTAECACDAHH